MTAPVTKSFINELISPIMNATIDGKDLETNVKDKAAVVAANAAHPKYMLGYNEAFSIFQLAYQACASCSKGIKDTVSYEIHNSN
ncbi:hypothetical protein [Burkholderia ambifaria]|uniref:hypothetical protein n=1 Tax=Burkholderia ambifaria TaxID=152480 RepID=UPI001590B97B|nr:hypothetical protein [Burkholderia ambifaria]